MFFPGKGGICEHKSVLKVQSSILYEEKCLSIPYLCSLLKTTHTHIAIPLVKIEHCIGYVARPTTKN